ncbi:MAG: hypothetical protein AAF563_09680 [Pseudomonadota bacterium]
MASKAGRAPSQADIKIFMLSTISLSVAAWDIAFNLGVFNTIFFDKVFTVWAASTAALFASFFVPPPADRKRLVSWRGRFVLLIPTLWMLVDLESGVSLTGTEIDAQLSWLSLIVAVVTLPYTLYVLVIMVTPDLINLKQPLFFVVMFAIVAFIALVGYAVGYYNEDFLTCQDFIVSGNDTPARCKG